MARIRTIKPDFFKHEDLAELPAMTRLLFIGLWTQADREGRLEDRPKRLKIEIFPYEEYDIEAGLSKLTEDGFIIRYDANGKFIQIANFAKHQQPNIKEKPSTIPAPCLDGTSITGKGMDIGNGEQEGSGAGEPPAPILSESVLVVTPLADGLHPIALSINRPKDAPTVEQVQSVFDTLKAPARMRKFFEHYESSGWIDGAGRSIVLHWQSKASKWVSDDIAKEQNAAAKADEAEKKKLAKANPPPKVASPTPDDIMRQRYPERYQNT